MTKVYEFKAGETIGVIKHGGWGTMGLQGLYKVTKCNGNVIEIARESDGYVRTFSNRTGCEKRSYGTDSRYNSAQLVTSDRYVTYVTAKDREIVVRTKWTEVENAVSKKNLAALKTLIAELEAI